MNRRDFLRSVTVLSGGALVANNQRPWQATPTVPFDVYMTFDDGPSSNHDFKTGPTDIVLDILKENKASATFFLHGLHINDWDGPVMVRYLNDGHAIGNHLWRQGGNTIADNPSWSLMARQYLDAEIRIRDLLQKTDPDVYARYLAQPKLFRRPGGNNGLNDFLKPEHQYDLLHEPYLRAYWDQMRWLIGVYDYSGWNINGGESIPVSIRPKTPDEERQFILHGRNGYYGIAEYTQPRSVEADAGLIILMHDADKDTDTMLPQLIKDLRDLGATFRSLPRPTDAPNTKTVGIGYPPTLKT